MPSDVTEKLIAQQLHEAQAIIRLLLAEIQELKAQLLKLTPHGAGPGGGRQRPFLKFI